jgi:hypothetical protein
VPIRACKGWPILGHVSRTPFAVLEANRRGAPVFKMPRLYNAKHEAFAQAVAADMSLSVAYEHAGFVHS